jgi:hypothetical protein
MTLAVPGSTGLVALAQRAVIVTCGCILATVSTVPISERLPILPATRGLRKNLAGQFPHALPAPFTGTGASNGEVARLTSLVLGRSKAESSGLVLTTERRTAVDPRNALRAISTAAKALGVSGVGLHTLRHSPRACSRPACHCIPSRSYSGTPSSQSPGTCTATSPTRVRSLPFSRSQQQWAGENVCRGYTDGYTAAERPPRILSETASDLLFPVGMTGFEPAAP